MEATIIQNESVWDVVVNGETVFTHPDKIEAAMWANSQGYTITN